MQYDPSMQYYQDMQSSNLHTHSHHHLRNSRHHAEIYGHSGAITAHHRAKWTHEVIAGAAAFEAMRLYEKRRAQDGYHDHALAREILAGLVVMEIDKLFETKGLDWIDRERAKQLAHEQTGLMYDAQFGNSQGQGGFGGGSGGNPMGGELGSLLGGVLGGGMMGSVMGGGGGGGGGGSFQNPNYGYPNNGMNPNYMGPMSGYGNMQGGYGNPSQYPNNMGGPNMMGGMQAGGFPANQPGFVGINPQLGGMNQYPPGQQNYMGAGEYPQYY